MVVTLQLCEREGGEIINVNNEIKVVGNILRLHISDSGSHLIQDARTTKLW